MRNGTLLLHAAFLEGPRAEQTKAMQVPAEMQAIEERIERLRARLRNGDPSLAPDELEAALAKAEKKRRSLLTSRPSPDGARVIAVSRSTRGWLGMCERR